MANDEDEDEDDHEVPLELKRQMASYLRKYIKNGNDLSTTRARPIWVFRG